MTAKAIFEAMLIELSKVNAPSLLLEDFNYLFNKAINQYVNKQYNIYDVNQQTTDNLRVLKSTAKLTPTKSRYRDTTDSIDNLYNATYEVKLPDDYLHILNCVCIFKVKQRFKCYNQGTHFAIGATRLTSDAWSKIVTDYYNRPTYRRPYYYINNINTSDVEPYAPYNMVTGYGTDQVESTFINTALYVGDQLIGKLSDLGISFSDSNKTYVQFNIKPEFASQLNKLLKKAKIITSDINFDIKHDTTTDDNGQIIGFESNGDEVVLINTESGISFEAWDDQDSSTLVFRHWEDGTEFPRSIVLGNNTIQDIVDKTAYTRHSNASSVICEIRCGRDNSVFELEQVYIDYIKSPQHIRLTQEELDRDLDTSQVMEYPDYVCQEIINELVTLVMENTNDQRLQNHLAVSQSIASPTQQQAQQPQS